MCPSPQTAKDHPRLTLISEQRPAKQEEGGKKKRLMCTSQGSQDTGIQTAEHAGRRTNITQLT